MNVEAARVIVRNTARNAAGEFGIYTDADIDRAIQLVGNHFVRFTQCTRARATVTLEANDPEFAVLVDRFRAEYLLRAWIGDDPPLSQVDLHTLIASRRCHPGADKPQQIAFATATDGEVWPTPAEESTLKLLWVEPFTAWPAGAAGDDIDLNIPDEYLHEALVYGAAAVLQHTQIEVVYTSESWQRYMAFATSCRGRGNLGARVVHRTLEP